MNEQSVLENEKISEKIKSADKPAILKAVLAFLAGFATSLLPESFRVSPFCAAAIAASPREYAFLTFLGGVLGYALTRKMKDAFSFAITLTLVLASKTALDKRFKTFKRETVNIVFSAFFVLAVDFIRLAVDEISFSGIALCFADAAMCAASVYFFSRSLGVPAFRLGLRKISGIDACCIVISCCIVLACVEGISVSVFCPARIFASLFIMFCALYKGASASTSAGVALGLVLSLSGNMHIFFIYSLSSLICSLFSPLGQYAVAASFAASASAGAILYGMDMQCVFAVTECAVASAAFVAIPSKWISSLQDALTKTGFKEDNEVNKKVALDLKAAAKTVDEVTDIISRVTKRMDNIISPELSRVYAGIQREVCAECEKKEECWNGLFDGTVKDIEQIARWRLNKEPISKGLENGLEKRCTRLKELSDEIDLDYKSYVSQTDARIKIEEMRSVVSDQFAFVSQLLDDVSTKIVGEKTFDTTRSRNIKTALCEERISAQNVSYWENANSRAVAEITLYDEPEKIDHEKIRKILARTTKKEYKAAEISVIDFSTVLTYRQKSEFQVSIGLAQIPFGENRVCGDKVETLDDCDGNTVAIISDGMGTGSRAAIDGTMTCSLMQKLIASGFTFESALQLVNSALIVKSKDESLATVDAVSINTYNALATFYKAGAAQSYIRSGDGIEIISHSSLPVGILRDVSFAKETVQLKRGDILLLISDGVTGEDDSWIEDELLSWSTDNVHELAVHIAQTARMKNGIKYEDDISVVAMKIKKCRSK